MTLTLVRVEEKNVFPFDSYTAKSKTLTTLLLDQVTLFMHHIMYLYVNIFMPRHFPDRTVQLSTQDTNEKGD